MQFGATPSPVHAPAQVVFEEGRWIQEHIKTAVLKFNYEIDKIEKLLIRDFSDNELEEYNRRYT